MLKRGKTLLPNKTWETWKKSGGDISLITDPRNKEQVRNRRKLAQRMTRFGKDTLFNLSILGSELIYNIGNNVYPFVTFLNLVEFNVCLHMVCAPLIEEMLKTMTSNDVVSEIYYDTGFDFGKS
uniref:Uncharacterized protein n=1 Tax=Panagrolaimus superbus TaxID=310955 RepID=A0A914Z8P5_9BILA